MRLFGERGVAAVSVRDIASAAGVSPALVIHHYKSKDGLKQAVDERALQLIGEMFAKTAGPQDVTSMASMAELFADEIRQFPTLLPYLRRLLVDGGEQATALFAGMYEGTRDAMRKMREAGLVAPAPDEDVRAAFLLVNDLGAVILREQVSAVLGFDPMIGDGLLRWGETVLHAYTHPTYTPHEEKA